MPTASWDRSTSTAAIRAAGWDTDQFPNNAQDITPAIAARSSNNGGLNTGGCNFDAKLRRQSIDANDLYIAHIAGIDTLARAVLTAESIIKEKRLAKLREERYAGWNGPLGKRILSGDFTLQTLADHAVKSNLDPKPKSGRQELFEEIVANHCKF